MSEISSMEMAMSLLCKTFHKYANPEGKPGAVMLTKHQVRTMLEKEMPGMMQSASDPAATKEFMQSLDHDGDSMVNFKEFMMLVASLTITLNDVLTSFQQ